MCRIHYQEAENLIILAHAHNNSFSQISLELLEIAT